MTMTQDVQGGPARTKGAVPGPRGLPLLGVLLDLVRDPLGSLLAAAREYGGVVALPVGTGRLYLVSDPDGVRQALQGQHQRFVKAPHYKRTRPLLGDGLITSDGALWHRQRRLTQPAFQRKRRDFFATVTTTATDMMLRRWSSMAARDEPVDLTEEMIDLAKEVLFKAMFGGAISDEDHKLTRALYEAQQGINPVTTLDRYQIVSRLPTPRNRRTKAALRVLNEYAYRVIAERRRRPTGGDDFLSLLLAARDEETGAGMSDQQVRDEVITILQAGHETTANALTWTCCLLAQTPDVQERVYREIVSAVGDRLPLVDDVARLPFTTMVIHEAMRLYPPAWVIARSPIEDVEIGGYRLPVHSIVVLSPYVTHRLPALWESPNTFDPERFSPERTADRPRFAYYPFGGGPRLCAGEQFAQTEMPLALAMMLRAYRLELVPGQSLSPRPLITLLPPAHLTMRLRPR